MEEKDRLALCRRMNPDHVVTWLVATMRERDAAVLEKNSAVAEKRSALADRDNAYMQRNVAYADRDSAILDRDRVLAALDIARAEGDACVHCSWSRRFYIGSRFSQPISLINTGKFSEVEPLAQSAKFPKKTLASERSGDKKGKKGRKSKKLKASTNDDGKEDHADNKRVLTARKVSEVPKLPSKKTKNPKEEAPRAYEQSDSVKTVNENHAGEDGDANKTAYFHMTIPSPYCSCTGKNQQCYRWGRGGWQSACCTNMISMHPLPMNPKKAGCRVAGRKMSAGAFGRLLERLASEGWDVNIPVDLKDYWSKHGTNRYITIK
ncbi:hypothetical protein O6H91_Y567900 [Diphasiastrum complanatum]|nr:hypothetical protein O6H91_Y567900 [Diphasiastrum complanatum]